MGSAQRRMPYGILQQGSILISTVGHEKLYEVLRKSSDKTGEEGMTSISACLEGFREIDQLKESLKRGFRQSLGIEFIHTELTRKEELQSDRLDRNRYRSREWNWHRKS